MNKRYRKTVIAGNWKMNNTAIDVKTYADEMKPLIPKNKWCEIVLCVPFVDIPAALKAFRDTRVAIGAQNVHHEEDGAYTGEVSAAMLAAIGVRYVIVGHSERRQYFGETDVLVNKKVHAAVNAGITPIICVGETLEQRELGITTELVAMQVKAALSGVPSAKLRHVVIAYEPIWAIGSGLAATAEEANGVNEYIRTVIRSIYGARGARSVTIQYGGSMNSANARELLAQPDVDGGLIGGASLKVKDFISIVNNANQ